MVQYIPPPDPKAIFPQHNPSPLDFFSAGLGEGLPSLMQGLGQKVAQSRQQAKMKTFLDSLDQRMNPSPAMVQGPKGYVPPGAGPSAVPAGSMATPAPQPITLAQIAKLYQFAPGIADQIAKRQFPVTKGMTEYQAQLLALKREHDARTQPPETFYMNPKTGEPSLIEKEGFMPVHGTSGAGARALMGWKYHQTADEFKNEAMAMRRKERQITVANAFQKQFMPIQKAQDSYQTLADLRKDVGKLSASKAAAYQKMYMMGPVGRAALDKINPKARQFLDAAPQVFGGMRGEIVGGRVSNMEMQLLQNTVPTLLDWGPSLEKKMSVHAKKMNEIKNRYQMLAHKEADMIGMQHDMMMAAMGMDDAALKATGAAGQDMINTDPNADPDLEQALTAESLLDQDVKP